MLPSKWNEGIPSTKSSSFKIQSRVRLESMSAADYLAIKVAFLQTMRKLHPKDMATWIPRLMDVSDRHMSLPCQETGRRKILRTSRIRCGCYGAGAADSGCISTNVSEPSYGSRCWATSSDPLHLRGSSARRSVHDDQIMYDFVVSSWETWPDSSHREALLKGRACAPSTGCCPFDRWLLERTAGGGGAPSRSTKCGDKGLLVELPWTPKALMGRGKILRQQHS